MTTNDSVYRERQHLVANLASRFPSCLVNTPPDEDGVVWPVVYITLPTGQVSWHISPSDLDLFKHVAYGDEKWDGHTTEEKYRRLDALTKATANLTNKG